MSAQVSLRELSPTTIVPEGLSFVILKSNFDGGCKDDSSRYDVLTLAVASGTDGEWGPFERDWRSMLLRHHAGHLHTTDAVSRKGIYMGWTEDQADRFLRDCARIISRHFIRMNDQRTGVLDQWSLYCFVVSIVLKDFVAHAESHPEAPQNANEGCIRQAIGDALVWCRDFAKCDQMRCFFDRGEPFHGYLKHMLESKKAKADAALLNLIQHASESNAALLPALQMADMFAWVENNKSEPWNPTWKKTILGLPYRWQRIDKSNIHDVNHAHQITWNTWKIPKRAKTK